MNTSALLTMIIAQGLVTGFTVFHFIKVLKAPKRPEPDSFTDNDNEA